MSASKIIPSSILDITAKDLCGNEVNFAQFKDKNLLIVNIASKCKLTKANIAGLRNLKQKFQNGEITN